MVTLSTTSEDISEAGTNFQPPLSQLSSPKDIAPRLPSIDQPPNFLHHSPPALLSENLSELRRAFPHDLFEGVMNHTASTTTDFETVVQPNEPLPLISEETFHSKIKCLDCPGRLHSPGLGMSIDNFQIHLKSRLHRENVQKSVKVRGQQPHHLQAKTLVAPAEVSSIRTPKERHITQASV